MKVKLNNTIAGWNIEVVTEKGQTLKMDYIPSDIAQLMNAWIAEHGSIQVVSGVKE